RADLARHTELGLSTITYIIDELISVGLVIESGSGESSGGRKPAMVEFNGSVAAAIGIKIEPTRIVFGRMNLLGKIEQKLIIDLPGEAESEELNRILIENMERLEEMAKTKSPLVGIGIAVSGLV